MGIFGFLKKIIAPRQDDELIAQPNAPLKVLSEVSSDAELNVELAAPIYAPLNEPRSQVRLLVLKPPPKDNPGTLEGTLIGVDFSDNPEYEALSYEWGRADADKEIMLNGTKFYIRENLWHALLSFRKAENRILWVDAICVNQEDDKERSHQVGQMSQIFSKAKSVLIWLGPESEQNSSASAVINTMRNRSYTHAWRRADIAPGKLWPDLLGFLDHSYFRRLWIVQEVLLAQRLSINCGRNSASWNDFEQMCDSLCALLHDHTTTLPVLKQKVAYQLRVKRRQRQTALRKPLLPLLQTCEYSLCHDTRDKVFGLLGLADDLLIYPPATAENMLLSPELSALEIRADYESSSPMRVYEDVVRFQNNRLWPQHFIEYHTAKELANYNTIAFSNFLIRYMSYGTVENPFHDYVNQLNQSRIHQNGELIWVVGHSACQIVSVGPSVGVVLQEQKAVEVWMDRHRKPAGLVTQNGVGESRRRSSTVNFRLSPLAITQAIRAPNNVSMKDSTKVMAIDSNSATVISINRNSSLEKMLAPDGDITPNPDDTYTAESRRMPENIYMYAADDGEVGIGPSTIENGDIICRFPNCSVVVIIRKVSGEDVRYKIVGRALKCIKRDKDPVAPHTVSKEQRFRFRLDILTLFLLTR